MKIKPLYWIIGVIVVIVLAFAGYYNRFVTATNGIDGQWKQVEVQYQRRFDLIPNLVNSVKGLMQQEQKVFGDIAAARAAYTGAQTTEGKVAAANQVEGALGRLIAIFENYPQIKSDQAVLRLQDELSGTENRISVERRRYNDLVQAYNISISTLPGNIFAKVLGFKAKPYFESSSGAENAPKVEF